MAEINKNLIKVLYINEQVEAVTPNCKTCGGPHSYNDFPTTVGQTQNVYAAGAYQGGNFYQPQGTLPSNTITNPKEDMKGITTRSGIAYQEPMIPTSSSLSQVVERETEVTKDTVPPTNNGSTKDVQPLVVQIETLIPNSEPVISLVVEPVVAPANDQKEKFYQIFQDLNFNISFADALILMPKFDFKILGNYNDMMANRIDVIYMAYEECSQEFLGFSDVIASGNPTPYYDLIVSTSSPTLTPFEDSDFLLEEVDTFLTLEDDSTSLEVDHSYYDTEGDILLLEAFINDDPTLPPPTQGMYLPQEKSHFMVKEGIVLGHKMSKNGTKVDKAKVDVIAKLPPPTTVKVRIKSSGGVFTARKPLTFSRLAIMDLPGDTMARTTPPKMCLTLVFIGPQSTMMARTWSNLVTLVNVRERFHNEMKCLNIPSKFVKFSTFGASISWGRSRLHEGTNIYSWLSITCQNGLKRKRSLATTPELFANS
nr:reverse transcriptase domain-containing protein [Tanacetum cinerariifolium]